MGFPSTGFERLFRNDLSDVLDFFSVYHDKKVKIYNLCIESNRIYPKSNLLGYKMALFPIFDHSPCPVRMMLEFCIDLTIYLASDPSNVAAVHCKAGKGRTGMMICAYLLFSGLCSSAEEAITHYNSQRTYNSKGVTILSQQRYIKYFQAYLQLNFKKPYLYMIPRIISLKFKANSMLNIIRSLIVAGNLYRQQDKFTFRKKLIGPFKEQFKEASVTVSDWTRVSSKFEMNCKKINKRFYAVLDNDIEITGRDLCFTFNIGGKCCSLWFNLYYETLLSLVSLINNTKEGMLIEEGLLHEAMESIDFSPSLVEITAVVEKLTGVLISTSKLRSVFKRKDLDNCSKGLGDNFEFILDYSLNKQTVS